MLTPTSRIQSAYYVGRRADLPLGGLDCVGLIELHNNSDNSSDNDSRDNGGRIDVPKLREAFDIASDQPCLRARFVDAGLLTEEPHPDGRQLPRLQTREVAPEAFAHAVASERRRLLEGTVDLDRGTTWAATLLVAPTESTLLIAVSLAMVDIAGFGAWLDQVTRVYAGEPIPDPPETLAAVRELLENARRPRPAVDPALAAQDGDLPHPPDLVGCSIPTGAAATIGTYRTRYSTADWQRLADRATELGGSTAALVLALYDRVLRSLSTRSDFLVTITGVDTTGTEELAVDRTVTYGHRARPMTSFPDLVKTVQADLRLRIGLGIDCAEEIRTAVASGGGHPGISPYVFTYGADRQILSTPTTATFGRPSFWSTTPQAVIDCRLFRLSGDEVEVAWDVRYDALDAATAEEAFAVFTESIDDVITTGAPTDILSRQVRAYREQVNTTPPVATDRRLYDDFLRHVEESPDAVAVQWDAPGEHADATRVDPLAAAGAGQLTYRELDVQATALAAQLGERTRPGDVIAVRLPKGPGQVIAVLAVHLLGCAYLPIGVDAPERRVRAIEDAAAVAVTVGVEDVAAALVHRRGATTHDLERSAVRRDQDCQPDSLAYIIYTSGSTGTPKGVAVSHAAAANTVADVASRIQLSPDDAVLAISALEFDLSVFDIFGPLSCGARIVTVSESERKDAFRWAELVRNFHVTVWNSVPELLEMLLVATDSCPDLRVAMCSGDWIDVSLPGRLRAAAPGSVLVAMGGATEAAIWSNIHVVAGPADQPSRWPSVPYGLPLSGQAYRVVDDADQDCPDGVTGELWIGGVGVALGYYRDPERTASSFVTDAQGRRWYRTGDLGVWQEGLLFFVGRTDTQVKIRGNRVECGEIEHALMSLPMIDRAIVLPIRDRSALGAVLVPTADRGDFPPADALRERLQEELGASLPSYMVPAQFVLAEQVALTANGKVDRQWAAGLLAAAETGEAGETGPVSGSRSREAGPVLARCRAVWGEVLGRDDIADEDNFFALGGDSVGATRVCAALRAASVGTDVQELFSHPTLVEFAQRCRADDIVATGSGQCAGQGLGQPSGPAGTGDAAQAALATEFPLTPLQQAYALGMDGIDGILPNPTVFATILSSDEPVTPERWHGAVAAAVAAYEGLRCRRLGDARQGVTDTEPRLLTLDDVGVDELPEILRRFPVTEGLHAVVTGVALAEDPRHYGLVLHYLGLDARSLMAVLNDIEARIAGGPAPMIDPSSLAFRRHVADRSRTGEEAAAPAPGDEFRSPPLQVVGELDRPLVVDSVRHVLSPVQQAGLEDAARRHGVTTTAVLLWAFGVSLGRVLGVSAFAAVVPVAQRPETGTGAEVLGNFTDIALVNCGSAVDVREVHSGLGRAAAGRAPGMAQIASAARGAYPVVFTSTIGLPGAAAAYRGPVRAGWTYTSTPGVLIDCQVLPVDGAVELRWDFPRSALEPAVVAAAFAGWIAEIDQLDMSHARGMSPDAAPPKTRPVRPASPSRPETIIREALTQLDPTVTATSPVAAAWSALLPAAASATQGRPQDSRFLAECVTGSRRSTHLLEHPVLAPERLLAEELSATGLFPRIIEALRDLREGDETRSVLLLGSGTGVISELLQERSAAEGLRVAWHHVETDPLLADIGRERGIATTADPAAAHYDAILAIGSLHRDPRLYDVLAGNTCRLLVVVEVTGISASSLVAAVLDPRIVSADGANPLRSGLAWAMTLAERGYRIIDAASPGGVLTYLAATPAGRPLAAARNGSRATAPPTHATPPPADHSPGYSPPPPGTPERSVPERGAPVAAVIEQWATHLGQEQDSIREDSDFFALGGTSVIATRICADLGRHGYRARIVDLFNAPTPAGFAASLTRQDQNAPADPAVPAVTPTAPARRQPPGSVLTDVQRAYLVGRNPDYLLGGVAAHCYYEFAPASLRTDSLSRAVAQVVARHPALRTTIGGDPQTPRTHTHDTAVHPPVEIVDDVRAATEREVPDLQRRGPLSVRVSPDRSRVGIGMDNVLLDGVSMWRVMQEIGDLYNGRELPEPPQVTFEDYISGRSSLISPDDDIEASSILPPPRLPITRPIASLTDPPQFARVGADLGIEQWRQLVAHAGTHGVTPAALICAAYALEIGDWAGQDRFSLNVTTFDRDPAFPRIEEVVGDFTSLSIIPCRVGPEPTLIDIARALNLELAAVSEGSATNAMTAGRVRSREHGNPLAGLFPVVFTCGLGMSGPRHPSGDFGFGPMVFSGSQTPQVLLDLQVHDDSDGLHVTADHVTQLLAGDDVARRVHAVVARLAALLPQDQPEPATDPTHRADDLRQRVAQVWSEALETPGIAALTEANFFSLGGDSLRATRCVRELAARIHPSITMRMLLTRPDLDEFVAAIADLDGRLVVEEGTI